MKKISNTTKYLAMVLVFIIVVNTLLGVILTRQSTTAIRSLMEERMLDVSNTAAAMLNGDDLENLEAEAVDTPEYQHVYNTLACFQENIDLEYIYCVRHLGGKNFVFMIDPEPVAPGKFGEPVVYTDALYRASQGQAGVDDKPYEDKWGRFYSAFTPVFDSNHEVAGIVAVDFSAEWYERQITNLGRTIVIVILLSLLLGGLIVFLVAARYRKRFNLLYTEMNGLSDGIEELISEVSTEEFMEEGDCTSQSSSESPEKDEIDVMGNRIRALQDRLSGQIALIRTHAFTDGLTGMGNRAAYELHVKALEKMIREGRSAFSIAIFDINQLKIINDDYGHEEGDRVIREAASALKEAFVGAEVYRIGGDEFVVLQEAGDVAVPFEAFDRLSVGKVDPEKGIDISLSGGYAVFQQEYDREYSAVFIRADKAMYDDKRLYYQFHADRRRGE